MNAQPRTRHLQVVTPTQTHAPLIVFDQVVISLAAPGRSMTTIARPQS